MTPAETMTTHVKLELPNHVMTGLRTEKRLKGKEYSDVVTAALEDYFDRMRAQTHFERVMGLRGTSASPVGMTR